MCEGADATTTYTSYATTTDATTTNTSYATTDAIGAPAPAARTDGSVLQDEANAVH